MGAADEPLIYAGALVVSLILMTMATVFSGALLGGAFDLMELNHMRYQSMVHSYNLVSQDQNYVFQDKSEILQDLDGSNYDQCEYTNQRKITYLNKSNLNSTNVEASIQGHISECEPIRENPPTTASTTGGYGSYQRRQINLTYPAIGVAIEDQVDRDSWELVRTYPQSLTQ